ncbi:uncharacterized protein [Palaemon carinicauda]|uniref:uncharacterized protein isoform X2 n=1 Tax=Palaemon carinicauda TaxID=392227 RepID=UPI0035B69A3C
MPATRPRPRKKSPHKKVTKGKKNAGVMRAEVQKYKDREKRQGIYAFGCTSGNVKRDFGLSKGAQARAEANLTRILELASSTNGDNPPKNVPSFDSPDGDAIDQVNENTPKVKESAVKSNEKTHVEDKSALPRKEIIGSKESECSSSEKKTEEDERREILEQLAEVVISGIECKTRLLGRTSNNKGRLKDTFAALMSLPKENVQSGNGGVSVKMEKIKHLTASEQKVKQWSEKHFSSSQPVALKTPLSQDIAPIVLGNNFGVRGKNAHGITQSFDSSKCDLIKGRKRRSARVLVISPTVSSLSCPGSTIINPRALLLRYEEKLEKKRTLASINVSPTASSFNKEKVSISKGRDITCRNLESKELKSYKNENRKSIEKGDFIEVSGCKVRGTDRSLQELDISACSSKSMKSVIVNPLDYLKKYEKHAGDDFRKIKKPDMNIKLRTSDPELIITSGIVNRDLQVVPEPVPHRSVNGLGMHSTDVTLNTNRGSEISSSHNQGLGYCHQVPDYLEESLKKMDSNCLSLAYEKDHPLSGSSYGVPVPLSQPLEEPHSSLMPAVKYCVDNMDLGRGKCFLPPKHFLPIQEKNKSWSPTLDVIEEAVLKDFVFPKYVEKNSDRLRINSNLKSIKELENFIT